MNSIVSSNQRGWPGRAALVVLALFAPAALAANLVIIMLEIHYQFVM